MHLRAWHLFWSHHHSGGWNEKEPNPIPQKALKLFISKIVNHFHYIFDFDSKVLIIYFYAVCNIFTVVAEIYIHSQAELVVCFCKATQPRWDYFDTGTDEGGGWGKTVGVASEEGWEKKIFLPETVSQDQVDSREPGLLLLLQPEVGKGI